MSGLSAKARNGHGLDRLLATARLAGLALAQALPA
jgi:TetR/AcrR family transcriptional repressor for divergent bdcA